MASRLNQRSRLPAGPAAYRQEDQETSNSDKSNELKSRNRKEVTATFWPASPPCASCLSTFRKHQADEARNQWLISCKARALRHRRTFRHIGFLEVLKLAMNYSGCRQRSRRIWPNRAPRTPRLGCSEPLPALPSSAWFARRALPRPQSLRPSRCVH